MTSLTSRLICCTPVYYDDDDEDYDAERVWEDNRKRNGNKNLRGRRRRNKLEVLTGQNRRAVSLSRKKGNDSTVMYDSRSLQRSDRSSKKKKRSKSLGAMVRTKISQRIAKEFG